MSLSGPTVLARQGGGCVISISLVKIIARLTTVCMDISNSLLAHLNRVIDLACCVGEAIMGWVGVCVVILMKNLVGGSAC